MNDKIAFKESASCGLVGRSGAADQLNVGGYFHVEHIRDGKVIWKETFPNTVTTVGKNDLLDKYNKGSSYTQTWVMGLKGAGTQVAGDTQSSHAGWLEVGLANAPAYSGNRPAITYNAASSGSAATPSTTFTFTSGGTVAGIFMNNGGSATKDNTTGVLFSAGDFSGSRVVVTGDVLNVTYTLSC